MEAKENQGDRDNPQLRQRRVLSSEPVGQCHQCGDGSDGTTPDSTADCKDTKRKDENENLRNKNTEQEKRMNIKEVNHDKIGKGSNVILLLMLTGATIGILLVNLRKTQNWSKDNVKRKYLAYSHYNHSVDDPNGVLKHVHLVLERVGYEKSKNDTPWDLLWSHDYPFRVLYPSLSRLKSHQRVNHFPAIGVIVNKMNLATTDSKYIPKAFELPKNKEEFLKYASNNKNASFLQKHNQHRGVYLKSVSEIDWTSGESFVQEFVPNPFLVDGHKFDIGVYVVITSVNPLRLYWYKGDVLFRYCTSKYYPLDPENRDKYVIGDDYRPTWEVPSLAHPYSALGMSMKDAFDMYAMSKGKDTKAMWEEIQRAIVDICLKKVHHLVNALKNYASQDNFFELMRFDLIVDEDLKVYLLEANMSPNLSSEHFPPNQLLYEQVLYSLFSITGIGNELVERGHTTKDMVSSQKNIAVWGNVCSTTCKNRCEVDAKCKLCNPCIDRPLKNSLLRAHREFLHRADFRRLFPPSMEQGATPDEDILKNLTEYNRLQYIWYQAKCNLDITWCN